MNENRLYPPGWQGLWRMKLAPGLLVALCLVVLVDAVIAGEKGRLRKRTATPVYQKKRVEGANAKNAIAKEDDVFSIPDSGITPPDATLVNGGNIDVYVPTATSTFPGGEAIGTADLLDEAVAGEERTLWRPGMGASNRRNPSQARVPYEPPMDSRTDIAARAETGKPGGRENDRPKKRRSAKLWRSKRDARDDGPEFSGKSGARRAEAAAPLPAPFFPDTPPYIPPSPGYDARGTFEAGDAFVIADAGPGGAHAGNADTAVRVSNPVSGRDDAGLGNAVAAPPARRMAAPAESATSAAPVADGERFTSKTYAAPEPAVALPPPTRQEVEDYRQRLETRLLERYNNMPEYTGQVGRVTVMLSKPLQESLDGDMIRAEFDQMVLDPWGKRIPALEKEYYVVTFGSGGARQVRSDPSIRVGLDLEKTYSERVPLNADPFARTGESRAFSPAPSREAQTKMPDWWRPDFPELQ